MEGTVTIGLTDYERLKRRAELANANKNKIVAASMKAYDGFTNLIAEIPTITGRAQVETYFRNHRSRAEESIRKELEE